MPNVTKDTLHLLDLIVHITKRNLPGQLILVSFDIANIFCNINNERAMETVPSLLDTRSLKNPSAECIMEELKICL